ncbi:uncharacterized protein LOC133187771 isoform X2 [Saccostrea echinata]|uniref:uncharacterized protein LOC133187771 isoform X2 n=1 Tax=Saccostrea echinata TaxID=191078 RepID=UPI002A817407|nr:uncharacterized protein LOC133187771 isoform X2 [Saccostrea echinata]
MAMKNPMKNNLHLPYLKRKFNYATRKQIYEVTRDSMGNYIVPPDGKPLTSLGDPTPGPADYLPLISNKTSLPHYSISGKYKTRKNSGSPGPSDFSTSGDLIWKNKTVTFKGRSKCSFDEEAEKYCTVIGPAKYNSSYQQCGNNCGPKFSIAHKQRPDVYTGPPNSQVHPVDSQGFSTPGPNYRPNSSYFGRGPKKSFGVARTTVWKCSPGPSDYIVRQTSRGPSYSFGCKLPPPPNVQQTVNKDSPAPNTYDLGTTIGRATSVIIASRRQDKEKDTSGPSPARYYLPESLIRDGRATTLAYKWFDPEEPTRPGPTDYTLTKANLRKTPMFTNRQKTKPPFPDSLNYTPKDAGDLPGPGSYSTRKKFSANDSPAYKIGEKLQEKLNENPAPNKYEYEKGVPEGPAFSMGKRFDIPDSRLSPGPATYSPQDLAGAPKYSITGRHPNSKAEEGPGPNAYNLQHDQHTEVGTTLKSRASPYVYSGFQTNKFMEDKGPSTLAAQG